MIKSVPDFPMYCVTSEGDVLSQRSGAWRKIDGGKRRYKNVTMYNGYERQTISFARLVATLFIRPPEKGEEINHINGCKHDDRLENIEWCTHSQNMQHAYNTGLRLGRKPIACEQIGHKVQFATRTEAARYFGVSKSTVTNCLEAGRKLKGYTVKDRRAVNDF